jgi:hypothetical protein
VIALGMFDYLRSSYDLGEQFTDVVLHTKDIEDGIGGTMTDYWLDPAGQLWCPTYRDTHTLEIYEEGHPKYDPEKKFFNHEWIPTGKHGKYQPHYITKYVEVYPANWEGKWEDWPRLKIHFKRGILQDYENITGR